MGAQNSSRMSATTAMQKKAEVLRILSELAAAGDRRAEKAAKDLATAWLPSALYAVAGLVIITASEAIAKAFTEGTTSTDDPGKGENDK